MQLHTDNRGVSEVVGAILVFGLLIALLAIMQTQAVPAANQQVEFEHNSDVQSDFTKFHEVSSRVAASGTAETTRIRLGATYPTRLVFFNPRDPSGEVRTTEVQSVQIHDVIAADPDTRQYIDGSLTDLETQRLEYEPSYNEYRNAPTTVLEYGTVYRAFDDRAIVDDPGQIVSGNTISLTFYRGNLSRSSSRALSLEAQPNSAPARTVAVEPTAATMRLELPTRLGEDEWEEVMNDEPNVVDVTKSGGTVTIELDGSQTYNLRMSRIGIGSGVPRSEARYVTQAQNVQLHTDQANRIPIEVRDRYNNPVSGESVNLSVSSGEFHNGQQTVQTTTTDDGRPAARYFYGQQNVVQIEASYVRETTDPSFDPDTNKEDIRFNVTFNPQLDTEDPVIDAETTDLNEYVVCETDIGSLTCLGALSMYQVTLDYQVSDTGGSGLDFINVEIYEGGQLLSETTESLTGNSASGRFVSPLFPENEGEPDTVEITVYDNAGNSVNQTVTVSP